jgi:hypothetical protein
LQLLFKFEGRGDHPINLISSINHFLYAQNEILHIFVFVLGLDEDARIEPWKEVFGSIGAKPLFTSYHFLSLIADVVNWRWLNLSFLEAEGSEHGYLSQIHMIGLIGIVLLFEAEVARSDGSLLAVDHKVVVHHSLLVHCIVLCLVRDADRAEDVGSGLPDSGDSHLDFHQAVRLTDSVAYVVLTVGSFGVVPEVEGFDLYLLVVAGTKPDHQ